MTEGLHHFHKRKRVHEKLEPYPHPEKWKNLLDKLIYVAGIAGPIMSIPQLLKVWVEQNVAGISVISWASFAVINVFWIVYGVVHKSKPIVLNYTAWFIINVLIATGAVLYG